MRSTECAFKFAAPEHICDDCLDRLLINAVDNNCIGCPKVPSTSTLASFSIAPHDRLDISNSKERRAVLALIEIHTHIDVVIVNVIISIHYLYRIPRAIDHEESFVHHLHNAVDHLSLVLFARLGDDHDSITKPPEEYPRAIPCPSIEYVPREMFGSDTGIEITSTE